jgi:hypothetical protein
MQEEARWICEKQLRTYCQKQKHKHIAPSRHDNTGVLLVKEMQCQSLEETLDFALEKVVVL